MTAKSRAVVLDNRRLCDNKNRVVLFTEQYGKIITALAGYGKPAGHWGGAFEGGNILELSFLKRNSFYTVNGWDMIYSPPEADLRDFAARELILDATGELLPAHDPEQGLFKWLVWCLRPFRIRKVYAYLARLIYQGGFLDFSDRLIVAALENDFEKNLEKSSDEDLDRLLRREMDFIQNFIGLPLRSYDFFKKASKL